VTALTLTNAYVDIGVCHFEPWGALLPATAAPGQSLILTQTGLYGPVLPEACNRDIIPSSHWDYWNFYTSGTPDDAPGDFDCAPTELLSPVITLVFSDGTTLTVTDADEVLNTGGINRFACTGVSETTPWTAVASTNIVNTP
jgi:hypothetical protein